MILGYVEDWSIIGYIEDWVIIGCIKRLGDSRILKRTG